jgi:chromate reductase
MSTTPLQLLGISGSLRRGSHCTAVLRTIAEHLGQGDVRLTLHPLNDVPLYDADLDGEHAPESVKALKAAIAQCDGLVVCSPEYNYGMSGVLKNAIDWASRPGFQSPLKGKPALIVTASPGTAGGVRAQYQIREALSATLARPIVHAHVAIPGVVQKITDGRLTDAATLEFVLASVQDLAVEIRVLQAGRAAVPGAAG